MEGEGEGVMEGGGNGGAGPSLSTVGARRLGVGGCCQPCVLGSHLCTESSFVGGGARSRVAHVW
jgi:hypothetical protein